MLVLKNDFYLFYQQLIVNALLFEPQQISDYSVIL